MFDTWVFLTMKSLCWLSLDLPEFSVPRVVHAAFLSARELQTVWRGGLSTGDPNPSPGSGLRGLGLFHRPGLWGMCAICLTPGSHLHRVHAPPLGSRGGHGHIGMICVLFSKRHQRT